MLVSSRAAKRTSTATAMVQLLRTSWTGLRRYIASSTQREVSVPQNTSAWRRKECHDVMIKMASVRKALADPQHAR